MAAGRVYSVLFALIMSLTDATRTEPSIAHSVFLSREFDPFCDTYVETITRMNINDLIRLPKLSDLEFLTQLTKGIDSIPVLTNRAIPGDLFNPNIDEQIEYQPDIDMEWEELMSGGPASINYMGVVMAVASKKDFSLKSDFNYTYVKYPNSFHATLVQVSNDMYRALYGAHTSMDKIQTNMRQIPALLKTALRLITQSSISMNKAMLPRTLASIGRYANDSAAVAQASLERIEQLQYLLQEIVQVSTLTNKDNRDTAEKLANETQKLETDKETMNIVLADIKAQYETARKDLEKAREDYHKAMLNVPGGQWDASAWNVYAANRPSTICSGWWIFRKCKSQRDQQFTAYTQEAKKKAEEALELLKKAEEHSKYLFDKQMNKQDELGIAMSNLATINFNELSINQTIKVLLDATEQIAKVQAQWSRITRFFSKLAIESDRAQTVVLNNFLGAIADVEAIGKPLDPIDQALFTMLLVETATDIDRDSHLLFLMAKTYLDVSNEYMVDQIASISALLLIQTDAARDAYVKEVANKSKATSEKVKELAAERRRNYDLASIGRQEQYMEFIHEATLQEETDFLNGGGIGKR